MIVNLLSYLKARLAEKSTYAAIGMGIAGAAALPMPWSIAFGIVGVIGALVPTSGSKDD